jgi:hypothetical protein
MAGTTHRLPLRPFPAPVPVYDLGNESAFRRILEQTLASITAYVDGLTQDVSSVAEHDLLSATHTDTLAASVVRGDILVGNATPKWARLAKGTSGYFLKSDGTDTAWAAHGLTYSDVGASPLAGSSSLVTVGALAAGSIVAGFGGAVFAGDVVPGSDATYDLGIAGTQRWRSAYLTGLYQTGSQWTGTGLSTTYTAGFVLYDSTRRTALTSAGFVYTRVAAAGQWAIGRVNGTSSAPTPVLSGQELGEFLWQAYNGAALQTQAFITAYAVEDAAASPVRRGTSILVTPGPMAGATLKATWTFDSEGGLLPGNAVTGVGTDTYDVGSATQRVRALYAARVTAPLMGTVTAADVVFDRNSVTQLTLGSLLGTFAGALVATTGFGCNSKSAQTAYASGGAKGITPTLGGYGFASAAEATAFSTLLENVRLALVADGVMS